MMKQLFFLILIQPYLLLGMESQHAQQDTFKKLRAYIIESNSKKVEELLNPYKSIKSSKSPTLTTILIESGTLNLRELARKKQSLIRLAKDIQTYRVKQDKECNDMRFVARFFIFPCIFVKSLFDIASTINAAAQGEPQFFNGTNLLLDGCALLSGCYNVYRLTGPENAGAKRYNADTIVRRLEELHLPA